MMTMAEPLSAGLMTIVVCFLNCWSATSSCRVKFAFSGFMCNLANCFWSILISSISSLGMDSSFGSQMDLRWKGGALFSLVGLK